MAPPPNPRIYNSFIFFFLSFCCTRTRSSQPTADRRALGRRAARDGGQERPGLRLAAAQGARGRPARHRAARLRAARRARRARPRALRAPRRRGAGADRAPRAEKLREALALWRGPAAGDLAYEPFAQTEIARLEELRLAALEQRIDADLAAAATRSSSASSRRCVAEHPLRERLRSPADARALPLRPPGRGARGLPDGAARALGGARARARRGAEAARAGDPAARPGARPGEPDAPPAPRAVPAPDGRCSSSRGARRRSTRCSARRAARGVEPAARADRRGVVDRRPSSAPATAALADRRDELLAAGCRAHRRRSRRRRRARRRAPRLAGGRRPAAHRRGPRRSTARPRRARAGAVRRGACSSRRAAAPGAGPVVVPFGAAWHDWAALELGAWVARATGAPLRLIGAASDARARTAATRAACSPTPR